MLLVVVPIAMIGGWPLDPKRSWWGTGPMAIATDPVRLDEYRRGEFRVLLVMFFAFFVVIPVLLAIAGIPRS